MATIAEQLTQLQADKETLKTNLSNIGVEVLDTDTFTEMNLKFADTASDIVKISEFFNINPESISESTMDTPWLSLSNDNYVKYLPAIVIPDNVTTLAYFAKDWQPPVIPEIKFNNNVTNLYMTFYKTNAIAMDLSNCDTSNVTNMGYTFSTNEKIERLNLSSWITSNVTNMDRLFYMCSSLQYLDIRNFDFTNVTSKTYMFNTVPTDCEIIVKDDTAKAWVLNVKSDFTNIKTVAELEA